MKFVRLILVLLSGGQSELQTRVTFFGPSEKKLEINFERARDHFFDMPAKTAIFNNIQRLLFDAFYGNEAAFRLSPNVKRALHFGHHKLEDS